MFQEGRISRGKRQINNNNPDGLQGFIPEMLQMIKVVLEDEDIDFSYKIERLAERNYGARDSESGQWNGMIQELIEDVSIGKG